MSIKGFDFNGVIHKYDYNALDNIPDIETDKTLTIDGAPADAKATGDRIANLQALVGSPLTASTAAGMTDHSKIYVYVGSETGYTNGNWYYYNGSAWVSGGVYNSVAVDLDSTLTLANKAPDSKVVGDAISSLNEDITNIHDSFEIPIEWEMGRFASDGTPVASTYCIRSKNFIPVTDGEQIYINADIECTIRFTYFDSNKALIANSIRPSEGIRHTINNASAAYMKIEYVHIAGSSATMTVEYGGKAHFYRSGSSMAKLIDSLLGDLLISPWVANHEYHYGDWVTYDSKMYIVGEEHTSGDAFDSTKWMDGSVGNVTNSDIRYYTSDVLRVMNLQGNYAGMTTVGGIVFTGNTKKALYVRAYSGGSGAAYYRYVPYVRGRLYIISSYMNMWDHNTNNFVGLKKATDTDVVIDNTLSVSGQVADAKVTGDRISALAGGVDIAMNALEGIEQYAIPVEWEMGRLATDGTPVAANHAVRSKDYIEVSNGETIYADAEIIGNLTFYLYNSDKTYIKNIPCLNVGAIVTIDDENAAFARLVYMHRAGTSQTVTVDFGDNVRLYRKNSAVGKLISNLLPDWDIRSWAANTAYKVGKWVQNDGTYYVCKTAHTSDSTFSSTNWVTINKMSPKLAHYMATPIRINTWGGTWTDCVTAGRYFWVRNNHYLTQRAFEGGTADTYFSVIPPVRGRLYIKNNGEHYVWNSDAADLVSIENSVVPEEDVVIPIDLNWELHYVYYTAYGTLNGKSSSHLAVSTPIKLYEGDKVEFTASGVNNLAAMVKFFDRMNTYVANTMGAFPVKILFDGNVSKTYEYTVEETGYYLFSCIITNTYSLTVTRTQDSQDRIDAANKYSAENYLLEDHNWVDIYDYAPVLTKKRVNSILTYDGDDKVSSNHIVNAVAYPDGTIIACRDGGAVVKIAVDGTETQVGNVSGAHDWRGMFIDTNLNVYVSPHSTLSPTPISNLDRGLYRLPYGGNSLTKVISLCRSTTAIKKWTENTAYSVGDIVLLDLSPSPMYKCTTAHTSGSAFDESKFTLCPDWATSTAYAIGDVVSWNNMWFRCKTAHTSGSEFDYSKWDPAMEWINNDDTLWTMCEDLDGNLYAGVYSHSARANPSVYKSTDGGLTWKYIHNFITRGTYPGSEYGNSVRHVHCINFNNYDNCLYAAVGEINTISKSSDFGETPCAVVPW